MYPNFVGNFNLHIEQCLRRGSTQNNNQYTTSAKILQDMMLFLNWTRAAILYEDEYGLIRLQELVRFIRFAYIINTNT